MKGNENTIFYFTWWAPLNAVNKLDLCFTDPEKFTNKQWTTTPQYKELWSNLASLMKRIWNCDDCFTWHKNPKLNYIGQKSRAWQG